MYSSGLEFLKAAVPTFYKEVCGRFATELVLYSHPEITGKIAPEPGSREANIVERTVERLTEYMTEATVASNEATELISLLFGLQKTGESFPNLTTRLIQSIKEGALGNPETKDS